MIDMLWGTLGSVGGDSVVLDVGGVGFRVAMTPAGIAGLPARGREVTLHTHLNVREDQMALFGFASAADRDLFRLLLGATGIGPRLALAILATLPPADLHRAVRAEDAAALTAVPGIGRKSAQRLILELQSRLDLPDTVPVPSTPLAEAREALEGLGYQAAEVREALAGFGDPGEGVESILRAALKRLGGR
jgi:Holliday junction DNA helicase RuvA